MSSKKEMKNDTKDQDIYIYKFLEKHIEYCESIKIINSQISGTWFLL